MDISVERTGDGFTVHAAEIAKKAKLLTEVFPLMKLIGWYTFGAEVLGDHLSAHEVVSAQCEEQGASAMFLRFEDAPPARTSEVVPLTLYRAEPAQGGMVFVEAAYRVSSSEVENMAIDQLMASEPAHGRTALEVQNDKLQISLVILLRKIEVITAALQRLQGDGVGAHHQLLRQAGGICAALRSLPTASFEQGLAAQAQLSAVAAMLSCVTKTSGQLSSVGDAVNLVHSDRGAGK